jgi:HPt (histidine-containing phosphotransfer) domain-containing protein
MSRISNTADRQTRAAGSYSDLASTFDLESLLERCMGDAELATRLLNRFGQRLSTSVGEIEQALGGGDRSEALKLAHTLKGESGSLAASRVHRAAAALEDGIHNATDLKHPEIVRLIAALAVAADECEQCLTEAIDALSTSANHA